MDNGDHVCGNHSQSQLTTCDSAAGIVSARRPGAQTHLGQHFRLAGRADRSAAACAERRNVFLRQRKSGDYPLAASWSCGCCRRRHAEAGTSAIDRCHAVTGSRVEFGHGGGADFGPQSKLATARGLDSETATTTLLETLELESATADDLYEAMDWLFARQSRIEDRLAKRHLSGGTLVLYDVSSTYFEGRSCPLARLGHSRDERSGNLQIVFGLLANAEGCPIAVEVFEGNTGDPKTVASQVSKLRKRFKLERVILVGDRGMLTNARIREDLQPAEGIDWITALRAPQIQALVSSGALQLSLFDERDLAEISHPDYPGERLIACRNPLLAADRARKRDELLAATEKELVKIKAQTQRPRKPLRGKDAIGMAVGKVIGRYKVGKHFDIVIEDAGLRYQRKQAQIDAEAALDGIYVIRTSVQPEVASAEQTVFHYKSLSSVERAFRSMKSVDLKVRPIHHHLANRVRAHVFLCMLAYYVQWHMRHALAPILFDDHDRATAQAERQSIVAPAVRSPKALQKVRSKQTDDGNPVHSFQTLMADLGTITKNTAVMNNSTIQILTTPTVLQQRLLICSSFHCAELYPVA